LSFVITYQEIANLQQFPSKQTTRNFLKGLLCKPFKKFLGLGLSAKRCKTFAIIADNYMT
jgi:hypothetical protein